MKSLKLFFTGILSIALFSIVGCSKEEMGNEEINTANAHIAPQDLPNNGAKAKTYTVNFGELNGSGVSGMAELVLDGANLTVRISASGLEPGAHAQHIHGFVEDKRNSKCPPESADTDGNGLISVAEGAPFYGGILLSLTPFPEADENGDLEYEMTFEDVTKDLTPLQNKAIVLHGMDGMPFLPVACGQIKAAQGAN
ncbi:hypothetical protein MKO06_15730 [Gramella sp. GC03-9]|uniref:Uncharacterized protein n=1 Tax=Christiangramia oceanisediminis TaxID=2920386 RepID=A0A9X2KZV1_9FLAO|nr:hypothetical protein [Gramella oceanisediminis]MCP9201360.1 hypothetical protein [Gramella oceanisediminis]